MVVLYLIVLLALVFVAAHVILRPGRPARSFIISHRGAKGLAPENTLMGVQEAVRRGVAWTEIDIRRATDGALFVLHDDNLTRTTGRDAVADQLPSAEITALVVHTEPDVSPPAEDHVPLFETILECIAASPVTKLVVEVKDPARYPGIAPQIVEALRRTGTEDKVQVGSFDHAWLREFQPHAPQVPILPISAWGFKDPVSQQAAMADVYWVRPALDPTFVRRMHGQGKQVLVWTVDSPALMRLLLWMGVDGITTNRPDIGQEVIRS